MTHQQILEKAIRKAIDGGWADYNSLESLELINTTANTVTLKGWIEYVDEDGNGDESQTELTFNYKEIIFNHDFGKALWKGRVFTKYPGMEIGSELKQPAWQYHLQKMVISDDPIEYLGEHT